MRSSRRFVGRDRFAFSAVVLRFSRPLEQRASDTAEVVSDAPSVRVSVRSHGSSEKRSGAVAPSDSPVKRPLPNASERAK